MPYRLSHLAWTLLTLALSFCACFGANANAQNAKPAGEPLAELARQIATAPTPVTADRSSGATPLSATPLAPLPPVATATASSPHTTTAQPPRTAADSLPLGPATTTSNTAAPSSTNTLLGGGWFFNTLAALAVVLVLVFVARSMLTKWAGRNAATSHSPVADVLARIPIAPRNHLVLVRLGQRILVLGDSAQGLRTLESISDPQEIAELLTLVSASRPASISTGFRQLVNHFGQEHDSEAFPDAARRDTDFAADGDDDGLGLDRSRQNVGTLLSRLRAGAGGAA